MYSYVVWLLATYAYMHFNVTYIQHLLLKRLTEMHGRLVMAMVIIQSGIQ